MWASIILLYNTEAFIYNTLSLWLQSALRRSDHLLQSTSHQTLLPEQKTLVVCWHVRLKKENISNHTFKTFKSCAGCWNVPSTYHLLQEQAISLCYRCEEGDIPDSPLWIPVTLENMLFMSPTATLTVYLEQIMKTKSQYILWCMKYCSLSHEANKYRCVSVSELSF